MKCEHCLDDAVYMTLEDHFWTMYFCRNHIMYLIQNVNYDYFYENLIGIIGQPKTKITVQERCELGRLYHKSMNTGTDIVERERLEDLMNRYVVHGT